MSIADAARFLDIPYENAKLINKIFRRDGRVKRMNSRARDEKWPTKSFLKSMGHDHKACSDAE